MARKTLIKIRRDTSANWNGVVLAESEPGYDTTTKQLKFGDGVTEFQSLGGINADQLDSYHGLSYSMDGHTHAGYASQTQNISWSYGNGSVPTLSTESMVLLEGMLSYTGCSPYFSADGLSVNTNSGQTGHLYIGYGKFGPCLPVGWNGTIAANIYNNNIIWNSQVHLQTSPDNSNWTTRASATSDVVNTTISWTPGTAITEPLYVRVWLYEPSGIGGTDDSKPRVRSISISKTLVPTLYSELLNLNGIVIPSLNADYLDGNSASAFATVGHSHGGLVSISEVTGTSQSASVNAGYVCNNASRVTVTLPSTAAVGDTIKIIGKGAGGWKVAQNASQYIQFANVT